MVDSSMVYVGLIRKVMIVNKKNSHNNWATPPDFYKKLNEEFNFDFDPCPLFADFDGLLIEWGQRNFVNPPYSKPLKDKFIKKAYEESLKGKLSVMLLPVSTSTIMFHDFILPRAEIRFIKGRVCFWENGNPATERNTSDNMLVIFRPKKEN